MKVLQGQSLIDLAIQTSGSLEAAYDLAVANGLSITNDMSGTVTAVDVVKQAVVDYYEAKVLRPASAVASTETIFTEQFQNEFE